MNCRTRQRNSDEAACPEPAFAGQQVAGDATPRSVPRWHSSDLLGAGQEVEIEHGAALYRLRLTALGKLILTK